VTLRHGLAILAFFATASTAQAHSRATSYSEWTLIPSGATVAARVTTLELTRLALDPQATADYAAAAGAVLAGGLELWAGERACTVQGLHAIAGADGWLRAHWEVACPDTARADERSIRTGLLLDVAPGHLHFARVQLADGSVREQVLTAAAPVFALPAGDPGSFGRYVALGVDHILSGWDHLAFVLGLLLLAGTLGEMAIIATGFTLAHSLTLAASVLGLAQAPTAPVEALIGFTIALVAVENAWWRHARPHWMPAALLLLLAVAAAQLPPLLVGGLGLFTLCYFAQLGRIERPARLRIAMAMLFGLVHGFGFAGALLDLRLPQERLLPALLGFNSGVELGQLLVIAMAWPALWTLRRWPRVQVWAHQGLAAGLCGLGMFWFVARSFG
jgi:hypothetical protein